MAFPSTLRQLAAAGGVNVKLKMGYWMVTGLFCLLLTGTAVANLAGAPPIVESLRQLGYPEYFRFMLGVGKLLGVVALLVPVVPRTLREWAYAGFAIDLVAAVVSYSAVGASGGKLVAPVVALGLLLTSHQLWHRVLRGTEEQPAVSPALS